MNLNTNTDRLTLVYCNNRRQLQKIIKKYPSKKWVVLSDDSDVNLDFKSNNYNIHAVEYFDSTIPYTAVDAIVEKSRKIINLMLLNGFSNVPDYIIEWDSHIEGGFTTQILRNMSLNYIRLEKVCALYEITEVVIVKSFFSSFKKEIIQNFSLTKNLTLIYTKTRAFRLVNFFKIKPIYVIKKRGKEIPFCLFIFLKKILIFKRLISGAIQFNESSYKKYNSLEHIVIPAFSNSVSHINNRIPLLKEINHINYLGTVLCFRSKQCSESFKKKGFNAIHLLSILNFKKLLEGFKVWFKLRTQIKKNIADMKLDKNDINFLHNNELLISSLISGYINSELLERIFDWKLTDSFFSKNRVSAARILINLNSFYGKLIYYSAKKYNKSVVLFRNDTMLNWGYGAINNSRLSIDFQFCIDKKSENLYSRSISKNTKLVRIGSNNYSALAERNNKLLKFNPNFILKILFATPGVMPGMASMQELDMLLALLIKVAKTKTNIQLTIKPHPNSDDEVNAKKILRFYNNPKNVTVLNKDAPIKPQIESSDILLCKVSGACLEGMTLNVPVISVILDGNRTMINALSPEIEVFDDLKVLQKNILDLTRNPNYIKWAKYRLMKQNDYISNLNNNEIDNPERFIIESLSKRIQEKVDLKTQIVMGGA